MIVVGELINASRKAMGAAIKARDTGLIQKTAETLAGRDAFCTNFLQAYRQKKFEPGVERVS